MSNDTTIIASYSNRQASELLERYIAGGAIPCQIVEAASSGIARFRVLVPTERVADVNRLLDLVSVAQYDGPTSAEVVAGRLVNEGIPCQLAGRGALDDLGFLGRFSGPYEVLVPRKLQVQARQFLSHSNVSDAELTDLALRTAPGPDDQI